MTILAIDQGTSGTKALLHDGERVIAVVEHPVRTRYLGDGGVEADPSELLDSVVLAGRQALDDAGHPRVDMIGLANQGESVLAWDPRDGTPLSPVVVWQDRRADEICQALASKQEVIAERTGLVLDSYFSGPKMTWLRRHVTGDGVVTTTDSWLMHQLTGEFVTDITTASRSLLLAIDSLTWDPELIEVFDLAGEQLPRLVANDEAVGHTDAFGASVPMGGLILDQQAALAAQRCLAPGDMKCTYGTGAFLLANTGAEAIRSSLGLSSSAAWSVAGKHVYCLDAQVYTLGTAIRWLADTGVLTAPENLDAECADDAGGGVFVPALAGMAAPWWTSESDGALLRIGLATGRGQIIRTVVEGLACQIAVLARRLSQETATPLNRLRVDGGLTRSAVLMQAQADLLQVPVECYPSLHATALGAVAMGMLASGEQSSLEAAVPEWEPSATYEPKWAPERAAQALADWHGCVDMVLTRGGDA